MCVPLVPSEAPLSNSAYLMFDRTLRVRAARDAIGLTSAAVGNVIRTTGGRRAMANVIWTLIVVLFVLWVIGLVVHIGGALIHILLVVALVALIVNLLTRRRAG